MRTINLIDNPLNGVTPNFSVFGIQFTSLWQTLLGGLWAIAILVAIGFVIVALTQMATAGGNPATLQVAKSHAITSGIALGALAALAVIVGGILTLFG